MEENTIRTTGHPDASSNAERLIHIGNTPFVEKGHFTSAQFNELIDWIDVKKNYLLEIAIVGSILYEKDGLFYSLKGRILKGPGLSIKRDSIFIIIEKSYFSSFKIGPIYNGLEIKPPRDEEGHIIPGDWLSEEYTVQLFTDSAGDLSIGVKYYNQTWKFLELLAKLKIFGKIITKLNPIKHNIGQIITFNSFIEDNGDEIGIAADDFAYALEWVDRFHNYNRMNLHIFGYIIESSDRGKHNRNGRFDGDKAVSLHSNIKRIGDLIAVKGVISKELGYDFNFFECSILDSYRTPFQIDIIPMLLLLYRSSDHSSEKIKKLLNKPYSGIEAQTIAISPYHIKRLDRQFYPLLLHLTKGVPYKDQDNILEVKNLTVKYGNRTIINNANFSMKKGSIMGIVGESGAGKSTTIKAILGQIPYEGSITLLGLDAKKTKRLAPFIGYVPQDLSLIYHEFTPLENCIHFGHQYGLSEFFITRQAKKIFKDLNIEHVMDVPVKDLSGGQKRRVSIAMAMIHNPSILILDEPTSGLDPMTRFELWRFLDKINKLYGISLIVISHYLDEIEYSDKSAVYLRGKGFFDYDSPDALKGRLPGKGIAIEITLEKINLNSVAVLESIDGVDEVIQRGEKIHVLTEGPHDAMIPSIKKELEKFGMKIFRIEPEVRVDMMDYFTVFSRRFGSGNIFEQARKARAASIARLSIDSRGGDVSETDKIKEQTHTAPIPNENSEPEKDNTKSEKKEV